MWRLFAHNHWFTIKIFGLEVRLCSRCTGYTVGYFICRILSFLSAFSIFYTLETTVQLALCLLLLMPFALDWTTQSWGLRDSNNRLRFLTGLILGISVSLLSFSRIPVNLRLMIYFGLGTTILISGLFIKFKSIINNVSTG